MLCELSFTQLLKHRNRILKYLKEDKTLAERLKLRLEATFQYQELSIIPVKVQNNPKTKKTLVQALKTMGGTSKTLMLTPT